MQPLSLLKEREEKGIFPKKQKRSEETSHNKEQKKAKKSGKKKLSRLSKN